MDRALYVAMTGAQQTLRAQAVNSHNLANASTTGFRAELVNAEAQALTGSTFPSRVHAVSAGAGWDATAGGVQQTGRDLDIALRENVWLAVQGPEGREAYTRAGDLKLDESGTLRTSSGRVVLGDGGPVTLPAGDPISIGADGTLSLVPKGQSAAAPVQIGRLKLVNAEPTQLARGEDGLFRSKENLDPAAGNVLVSGALESSNVNLAETMVTMIQLARQFELQVKAMRAAEDNASASSSLVRL